MTRRISIVRLAWIVAWDALRHPRSITIVHEDGSVARLGHRARAWDRWHEENCLVPHGCPWHENPHL